MMDHKANFPDLSHAQVMGILNITPDSFFDGGRYMQPHEYLPRVEEMIGAGAAIIDIGAASTRPGAKGISSEDEWERLRQPLANIRKSFPDICISVDTYYAHVAERAAGEGAGMINDISGGTFDRLMPALIGRIKIPYVIMHIQGVPGNMQQDPHYDDVVEEIKHFFLQRVSIFRENGADKLILDPGFGFGKTVEHNFELLKKLARFTELGYPVMAGLSRKSMINKVLGTKPDDALNGTTVLNTIALMNGASILRVHDVREAVQAIELHKLI